MFSLVVLAAFAVDGTSLRPAVNPTDFKSTIVQLHNYERSQVGSPPLVWDERLARDAANWAHHLATARRFHHDTSSPHQGENLWMGSRGSYTLSDMMNAWTAEKFQYRKYHMPKYVHASHYTQQIWKSTQKVGCAISQNRNHEFFVCRYYPAGNVIGESPYQN